LKIRHRISLTRTLWTDDFLSPYTGSAGIVVDTFANAYVTGEHNFQVIADLLDLHRAASGHQGAIVHAPGGPRVSLRICDICRSLR
jgi:hypothetical protein